MLLPERLPLLPLRERKPAKDIQPPADPETILKHAISSLQSQIDGKIAARNILLQRLDQVQTLKHAAQH